MFSINKFANTFDGKAFLDDNSTFPCDCSGSPFVDKHQNHIITVSLKIVKIIRYAKFPLNVESTAERIVDHQKAKKNIITEIKSCISFDQSFFEN